LPHAVGLQPVTFCGMTTAVVERTALADSGVRGAELAQRNVVATTIASDADTRNVREIVFMLSPFHEGVPSILPFPTSA
jgi:hypothetical protein